MAAILEPAYICLRIQSHCEQWVPMADTPEPWRTAQLYLDECGDDAESEMRRLAKQLMDEGNSADAEKLFEAFQALKVLRRHERPPSKNLH